MPKGGPDNRAKQHGRGIERKVWRQRFDDSEIARKPCHVTWGERPLSGDMWGFYPAGQEEGLTVRMVTRAARGLRSLEPLFALISQPFVATMAASAGPSVRLPAGQPFPALSMHPMSPEVIPP